MFSLDHKRQVKDKMHTLFYLPKIHRHPNWGIETLYLLSGSERITSKRKKVVLFFGVLCFCSKSSFKVVILYVPTYWPFSFKIF